MSTNGVSVTAWWASLRACACESVAVTDGERQVASWYERGHLDRNKRLIMGYITACNGLGGQRLGNRAAAMGLGVDPASGQSREQVAARRAGTTSAWAARLLALEGRMGAANGSGMSTGEYHRLCIGSGIGAARRGTCIHLVSAAGSDGLRRPIWG